MPMSVQEECVICLLEPTANRVILECGHICCGACEKELKSYVRAPEQGAVRGGVPFACPACQPPSTTSAEDLVRDGVLKMLYVLCRARREGGNDARGGRLPSKYQKKFDKSRDNFRQAAKLGRRPRTLASICAPAIISLRRDEQ